MEGPEHGGQDGSGTVPLRVNPAQECITSFSGWPIQKADRPRPSEGEGKHITAGWARWNWYTFGAGPLPGNRSSAVETPEDFPMKTYEYDSPSNAPEEPVVSLAEIAASTKRHKWPILLSLAALAFIFTAGAIAYLLLKPARSITTLPFRLEFAGAERGRYPNGTTFSSAEIVSTPILVQVYKANDLGDVVPFQEFKSSIFVVESNPALEALQREYRAKLSAPRLESVDRARLEQEYEEKKESIARSYYAISYAEQGRFTGVPKKIREKVLSDILATWAEQTVQSKGVVLYDLPILSSAIFESGMLDSYDYIIALDILRSKINRIIRNIEELSTIPGAKVVRTSEPPQVTLAELRVRLEDQLKFRIDPLIGTILDSGISKNPAASISFLESRLQFNAIERAGAENRVEAMRESLDVYQRAPSESTPSSEPSSAPVMPQLDQGFIDRIIVMSGQQDDMVFRQTLVQNMQNEALRVVPLESEERYYRGLIESLRGYGSRARPASSDELQMMRAQVDRAMTDAVRATDQVNEIYRSLSQNLNPSTVLFSTTAPPATETQTVVSVGNIALLGLLLLLLAVPLAILVAFVHSRIAPVLSDNRSSVHEDRPAHPRPEAGVEQPG